MRAVWSFWSKPYDARQAWSWLTEANHLLAWVLSVETARQHWPDTALVTDEKGAELLVDDIGLRFDQVSTQLDELSSADPRLWTLGKLFALRSQTSPFIHIDADCFIWTPLPDRLTSADVFAQCPEPLTYDGESYYNGAKAQSAVDAHHGWLPPELAWFLSARGDYVVNTGIVGGTCVDFIQHYAQTAITAVQNPANEHAWASVTDKTHLITLIEQGALSACIEYHRQRPASAFRGVRTEYLFPSIDDAKDPAQARRAGFTHLLGPIAKRHPEIQARLRARVVRDYPRHAERCLRHEAAPTR